MARRGTDLEGSSADILGAAFQTADGFWQWFGPPTIDAIASTISISTTHFTDVSLVRGQCGDQGYPAYDGPDILIGNRLCDPFWDGLGHEINYSIMQ